MKSSILPIVFVSLSFLLAADSSLPSGKSVLVLVGDDVTSASITISQRLKAEADRYAIGKRFGVQIYSYRLEGEATGSLTRLIASANERAPTIVIALSHPVALAYATSATRGRERSLIFATRESPDEVIAAAKKNNIRATGTRSLGQDDDANRVSLLFEWLPLTSHIGVLWDGYSRDSLGKTLTALSAKPNVRVSVLKAVGASEITDAFVRARALGVDAMLISDNEGAATFAAEMSLAAHSSKSPVVAAEAQLCLALPGICFYTSTSSHYERWLEAIVQIMIGVHADDIPVPNADQATLLCNVRAATDIGVAIPDTIVARADYAYGTVDFERLRRLGK